nr:calcium permeable stress-gated cation channel 1-like [Dermatophagoides farinae]
MNINFDSNYTCNTLASTNQTMLKIDDGWETIPESIIIDLIFALILFIPYYYLPRLIRSFGWHQEYSSFSWINYFGKNNLFNLKDVTNDDMDNTNDLIINSDTLKLIETYLQQLDNDDKDDDDNSDQNVSKNSESNNIITTAAFLPKHFEPEKCPRRDRSDNDCTIGFTGKNRDESTSIPFDSETTDMTMNESSLCSKILRQNSIWRKMCDDFWTMGISDERIRQERGIDAYQYLLFQKYLICLLGIMTIISIFVILPVNIYSNSNCNGFACTSMNNLPHGSWLCWFHANLSVIVVLIALFLMNRFAQELRLPCQLSLDQNDVKEAFAFDEDQQQKILLIRPSLNQLSSLRQSEKIPLNNQSVFALSKISDEPESSHHQPNKFDILERLRSNLNHSYPFAKLNGIQLIMDNRRLNDLQQKYHRSWLALQWLQSTVSNVTQNKIQICPYGQICCCMSVSTDSPKEFYSKELANFRREINYELQNLTKLQNQSIRGIFVEFESEQIASSVYKRIKRRSNMSKRRIGSPNLMDHIETDLTRLIHDRCHYPAPRPDDINWRNLGVETKRKWAWKCLCTFILFIIFFFLSTPTYVFKLLDLYALKHLHDQNILGPISLLVDYLNPMLMVMLVSSMPTIVQHVLEMIPYQTISGLNYAIMTHLYSFMVLTIIILPSAGFLTMNAMLDSIFGVNTTIISNVPEMEQSHSSSKSFHWQCLFPVDNGAFFLIYIIHAAILGNLIELLRITDAYIYMFYYLVFIRSPAEYKTARMMVSQEFPLGVFYSQFLLIFTMTIIFSFASPLIVPCGLAYMTGKHLVDRYNIYHVYVPTKINSQIHLTAINYVHIGLVLMILQLFSVMLIKTEYSLVSRYILFVFICALIFSLIRCFCPGFLDRRRQPKRELGQQQTAIEISRQQQQQQQRTSTLSLSSKSKSLHQKQHSKDEICICSYTWPVLVNLLRDKFFSSFSSSSSKPLKSKE